jgi:hypothetical protein
LTRRILALAFASAFTGCSAASDKIDSAKGGAEQAELSSPLRDSVPSTALLDADSVVLTSSICLGSCPAYSVRIARTGEVSYFSRTHQESRTDSIAPERVGALLREIVASTFLEYPRTSERDSSKCYPPGSDAPARLVELYVGASRYYITGDIGCFWNPDTSVAMLRSRVAYQLAERIDSVAGTGRWVRPR